MATPPRKIFISYRQKDHPEFVERIWDRFANKFGLENVFIDINAIPLLAYWPNSIRREVEKCDAMLVIIGPRWLELLREKEAKHDDDWVRIEIDLALQLGKLVRLICILDTQVPTKDELPDGLRSMLDYQIPSLKDGDDFTKNVGWVIEAVEREMRQPVLQKALPHFESAKVKYEAKNYNGAIADCTEAIRLYPEYTEAYVRRGAIRAAIRDYDGAIADYNEALRLNPQYPFAYNNRAISRYIRRDYDGAITDYNEAIRLNINYIEAYINRSNARFMNYDYTGAIADLEKYLELGGGRIRGDQKEIEGVINDLKKGRRVKLQLKNATRQLRRTLN